MQVWVVRDSCTGNGNDDAGIVLGVFSSPEKAMAFIDSGPDTWSDKGNRHYTIDAVGPFELDNPNSWRNACYA